MVTNCPFAFNRNNEIIEASITAIREFGAPHASVACARAQTWRANEICSRLADTKDGNATARLYPTTFAANMTAAAGLKAMDATVFVHLNAHATLQSALEALAPKRVIRMKNPCEGAATYAKMAHRPVAIVEDGLYSMGGFADFRSAQDFLDRFSTTGIVWYDDAHTFGLSGEKGRGEAMERMAKYTDSCLVTGSLGKALGAAGGFLVGPEAFVRRMLDSSDSDRFSCNLDVAAQGAALSALRVLARPGMLDSLQSALGARLNLVDAALAFAGVHTEQAGALIPFRVIPFAGPKEAISAAGALLDAGFLSTPVYFPTIARGAGAIRISLSVGHTVSDIEQFLAVLLPLLERRKAS